MPLTTGSSEIGTSGLRTQTMGLNVGTSYLGSGGVRTSSISSLTPYQAHVARMQSAAPNSSGYYTAQDYTASPSQAGLFVDAFGGSLTYTSPNVQASPSRVVDGTSGIPYVSADGADDTAVGSAAQTIAAMTFVVRPTSGNELLTLIGQQGTTYCVRQYQGHWGVNNADDYALWSGTRVNGAASSTWTQGAWVVLTLRAQGAAQATAIWTLFATIFASRMGKFEEAGMLTWATTPSDAEVQATEQEMASYYGPLLNPPDPQAAHVARLKAIDSSGSYYTAHDYTVSGSQPGLFVDAFGGALTYTSPSVDASPARVVDATSGIAYASADGSNDTALASAAQTVAAYTAVFRSPPGQTTWANAGTILDSSSYGAFDTRGLGVGMTAGNTQLFSSPTARSVRRNGIAVISPYDLSPIATWQTDTFFCASTRSASDILNLFRWNGSCQRLHLAALLLWPTDPSTAEVQAAEQELASYYGPLIATNPS